MIKQGENQHIEFKKELNKKYKDEFIGSVVAFANGEGGAILIGVDDKSNIVGFYPDKIEEHIINIIRSRCDPFIEPEIKSVKIDDKPIIIVRIRAYPKSSAVLEVIYVHAKCNYILLPIL